MVKADFDYVTGRVVDSGLEIHRALGPGLLDSIYRVCLAHELRLRGFTVRSEVPVNVVYKGAALGTALRLDLLINDAVVVEVKSVAKVVPIHEAQLLSHLKLGNYRLGLLLNFNVRLFRHGITRMANGL